ncbi:hypothetical protein T310_2360 [Rasamsonia emersonii CBS 393.64]|uniref:Uncharacterized protein n=1 Tax=Rasamsonia emersonii (strain ATCC 16479 / CBS 393.64 / IMI 116815) TaxID=1408163 RepID=A0A0F4YZD0_RASE3|nr:hypothetical protein T310_2360 [Rasamsonia emersonii CBS 393.64]KKA23614.1 hypothetical protein T310_2360 [Rasamsonia emersonii CBS 393.64]
MHFFDKVEKTVWGSLCVLATLFLVVWYYQTAAHWTTIDPSRPDPVPVILSTERNYTRTLVVAKLQDDDTSWVDRLVHEDPHLHGAVYTVDNSSAELTVPMNKGHEAMAYLTYIIDHYSSLSDITLFMHAHQTTWHNNDFLDSDSALMVRRLRSEHVVRSGYMNLRCHQQPGCPDHIHPVVGDGVNNVDDDLLNIPEAAVIGSSWRQLFPDEPVPAVLSQPCCGQFAVSAERIRNIPLEHYVSYRDWLLGTELEDSLSGRVWEYLWQFLFTGQAEYCPEETFCYCEGYGVCFDEDEYEQYFELRDEARRLEKEIEGLTSTDAEDETPEDTVTAMKIDLAVMYQRMDEIKAKEVQ